MTVAGFPVLSRPTAPPELTPTGALTAFTANVGVLAVVALLGAAYVVGVIRVRGAGRQWPASRCWWFLAGGLGSILLVTVTALGIYDDTLFWVRAVQNVVLLMVAPMFLALGAPLTLLRETLPDDARAALSRIRRGTAARLLTFPPVVTVVLVAPPLIIYLTPLYEATLRSALVSGLAGSGLVTAGLLYFVSRLRVDPTPREDSYLVTLGISVTEVIVDGALGLVLWLGPLVAPHYYQGLDRDWGPDPRTDQVIGAGVLWIGGDLAGLPFLGAVAARMSREDQARATLIDKELDAVEATVADDPSEQPPLWWVDHPELAQRFRRAD